MCLHGLRLDAGVDLLDSFARLGCVKLLLGCWLNGGVGVGSYDVLVLVRMVWFTVICFGC